MRFGVQFRGQIGAGQTGRWFTHSWNAANDMVWSIVPTGPAVDGGAQIESKVQLTRQTADLVKYFIEVRNVTDVPVDFEMRYVVLNG